MSSRPKPLLTPVISHVRCDIVGSPINLYNHQCAPTDRRSIAQTVVAASVRGRRRVVVCERRIQVIAHALRLALQRHVRHVTHAIYRVLRIGMERCEERVEVVRRRAGGGDEFEGLAQRMVRAQATDQDLGGSSQLGDKPPGLVAPCVADPPYSRDNSALAIALSAESAMTRRRLQPTSSNSPGPAGAMDTRIIAPPRAADWEANIKRAQRTSFQATGPRLSGRADRLPQRSLRRCGDHRLNGQAGRETEVMAESGLPASGSRNAEAIIRCCIALG